MCSHGGYPTFEPVLPKVLHTCAETPGRDAIARQAICKANLPRGGDFLVRIGKLTQEPSDGCGMCDNANGRFQGSGKVMSPPCQPVLRGNAC